MLAAARGRRPANGGHHAEAGPPCPHLEQHCVAGRSRRRIQLSRALESASGDPWAAISSAAHRLCLIWLRDCRTACSWSRCMLMLLRLVLSRPRLAISPSTTRRDKQSPLCSCPLPRPFLSFCFAANHAPKRGGKMSGMAAYEGVYQDAVAVVTGAGAGESGG